MFDLFHEAIPDEFIEAVVGVSSFCSHTLQMLTKRADRMFAFFAKTKLSRCQWKACDFLPARTFLSFSAPKWPLQNLWLGVSVESRRSTPMSAFRSYIADSSRSAVLERQRAPMRRQQ